MFRHALRLLTLSCLVAMPLSAQASVTFYGKTCAYPEPMDVIGLPKLGTTLQIRCYSGHRVADSSGARWLVFGNSNQRIQGLPLPIEFKRLFGLSYDCGYLLVSAEALLRLPTVRGAPVLQNTPIQVPNQPALIGVAVHVQVIAQFTGWGIVSHASSQAATLVVGR